MTTKYEAALESALETQARQLLLLSGVSGGLTPARVAKLAKILHVHPHVTLAECADEKTGRRFGHAACRRGRAVKIGGGGRNRGSRYSYQIWAVW